MLNINSIVIVGVTAFFFFTISVNCQDNSANYPLTPPQITPSINSNNNNCLTRWLSGYRLASGRPQKILNSVSLNQCQNECLESIGCGAVAYSKNSSTCELAIWTSRNSRAIGNETISLNDVDKSPPWDVYLINNNNENCLKRSALFLQDNRGSGSSSNVPIDCFYRLVSGKRLAKPHALKSISVKDLLECQEACIGEISFNCRSISYRYMPSGLSYSVSNCELSPYYMTSSMQQQSHDFLDDFDYDFFQREPYCKTTGGGQVGSGIGGQGGGVAAGYGVCAVVIRRGGRLTQTLTKSSHQVTTASQCEHLCTTSLFRCRAFAFRHTDRGRESSFHNNNNRNNLLSSCQLYESDISRLPSYNVEVDPDYDLYEMGRLMGGSCVLLEQYKSRPPLTTSYPPSEGRYPVGGGYPIDNRYPPMGRYPESRYPDSRYPPSSSRYPDSGRYPDNRYPDSRYPVDNRYPPTDNRYPSALPPSQAGIKDNKQYLPLPPPLKEGQDQKYPIDRYNTNAQNNSPKDGFINKYPYNDGYQTPSAISSGSSGGNSNLDRYPPQDSYNRDRYNSNDDNDRRYNQQNQNNQNNRYPMERYPPPPPTQEQSQNDRYNPPQQLYSDKYPPPPQNQQQYQPEGIMMQQKNYLPKPENMIEESFFPKPPSTTSTALATVAVTDRNPLLHDNVNYFENSNNNKDVLSKEACLRPYRSDSYLTPEVSRASFPVKTPDECKIECIRSVAVLRFPCNVMAFRPQNPQSSSPTCQLSDADPRSLRETDFIPSNNNQQRNYDTNSNGVFYYDDNVPGCQRPNSPLLPDNNRRNDYYDRVYDHHYPNNNNNQRYYDGRDRVGGGGGYYNDNRNSGGYYDRNYDSNSGRYGNDRYGSGGGYYDRYGGSSSTTDRYQSRYYDRGNNFGFGQSVVNSGGYDGGAGLTTVDGERCLHSCVRNKDAGFYYCQIDKDGSWNFCCRPDDQGGQCGYSKGLSFSWCYVGSGASRDIWRNCKKAPSVSYLHERNPPATVDINKDNNSTLSVNDAAELLNKENELISSSDNVEVGGNSNNNTTTTV